MNTSHTILAACLIPLGALAFGAGSWGFYATMIYDEPAAEMTLPTPNYLLHPPQYIEPSPDYPLSRELKSMTEAAKEQRLSKAAKERDRVEEDQ